MQKKTKNTAIDTAIQNLLTVSEGQSAFDKTKGELYSATALFMASEGMSLTDFTARFATAKGSDWPLNDEKQPVGKNKAAEAGSRYAVAIQRYSVWYGANVLLDDSRVPVTNKAGKLAEKPKKEKGATKRKGSKENSEVNQISGDELIQLALEEMSKRIEIRRGKVKRKAQVDELNELKSFIDELSEFFEAINE